MTVLHIEHGTPDFDAWKGMFDADPADRKGSGVTAYRILRSADGGRVAIDLHFSSERDAEQMLEKLRGVWSGAGAAVIDDPEARIFSVVEEASL